MERLYKQCLLVRSTAEQVAWIPEHLAKLGKYLRIQEQNGWRVAAVYSHRRPLDQIRSDQRVEFPSI